MLNRPKLNHLYPDTLGIVFENQDIVRVPIDMVKSLNIGNPYLWDKDRKDGPLLGCNKFEITFEEKAKELLPEVQPEFTFAQRIEEWHDLLGVELEDKNHNTMFIYTPWGGNDDYFNEGQTNKFNNDGSFTITAESKTLIPCPYHIGDGGKPLTKENIDRLKLLLDERRENKEEE